MLLFDRHTIVEWRARRIADPMERLRFLREQGARSQRRSAVGRWPGHDRLGPKHWLAASLVVGLGMLLVSGFAVSRAGPAPELRPVVPPPLVSHSRVIPSDGSGVWLVEKNGDAEIYSNGLRVETRFAVSNIPRQSYRVFPVEHPDMAHPSWKDQPAGIVYHTTESNLAPFESGQNRTLQRLGVLLLTYVQRKFLYHYVIDRFGRVFRVVQEQDAAFHAGHSVWADDKNVYVNLNNSFLGIAFETQTHPGQDLPSATPGQIAAARTLTEMLRSRYHISAHSCVTHAQVSVNPSNLLIGYHTDWAGNFPFAELGLKDNYSIPPASLWAFGFAYDLAYVQSTGSRLLPGLQLAQQLQTRESARLGIPLGQYKSTLNNSYKEIMAAADSGEPAKETSHEQ